MHSETGEWIKIVNTSETLVLRSTSVSLVKNLALFLTDSPAQRVVLSNTLSLPGDKMQRGAECIYFCGERNTDFTRRMSSRNAAMA